MWALFVLGARALEVESDGIRRGRISGDGTGRYAPTRSKGRTPGPAERCGYFRRLLSLAALQTTPHVNANTSRSRSIWV